MKVKKFSNSLARKKSTKNNKKRSKSTLKLSKRRRTEAITMKFKL